MNTGNQPIKKDKVLTAKYGIPCKAIDQDIQQFFLPVSRQNTIEFFILTGITDRQ